MSGMFKSKKVTPEYVSTPADSRINKLWDQLSGDEGMSALANLTGGLSTGFTGEKTAPLTGMEKSNLLRLNDYLQSGFGRDSDLSKAATNYMAGFLNEDPWAAGGGIANTQNRLAKYLKEDLLPNTRHNQAINGGLYSSGLEESEDADVNNVMSEMTKYAYDYQSQLNSQKNALAPVAIGAAESAADEPLKRLMNTMGLAGYERTNYSQAKDTTDYNSWLQLMQLLQGEQGQMIQLAGTQGGQLAYAQYQPSAFEKYVMPMMQMGASVASAAALGSDVRLKEDIQETGETYRGLKLFTWKWKEWVSDELKKMPTIGFIAQDVLKKIPEAVMKGPDGFLMIDYSLL